MDVYGIDGCVGGWLVATAKVGRDSLLRPRFEVTPSLQDVFGQASRGAAFVAIDIPIGLCDREPRRCDADARAFLLRPRASSVFPAPCRCALEAKTYEEASRQNFLASGRRLSKQSYAILSKIREVDLLITPRMQQWVREAHPEVVFATLAGHPMKYSKRTAAGREERLAVLADSGLALAAIHTQEVRLQVGRSAAGADDIIDAAACLLAANRIRLKCCNVFPRPPEILRDCRGLRMEIVA
jgi:predicted RNase H-like nuclease